MADATLVVHRAAKTTRDQAARSVEALEKVGERPVGVILNMVTRKTSRYDYEYNYYYSYRPDRSRGASARAVTPAEPRRSTPPPQPLSDGGLDLFDQDSGPQPYDQERREADPRGIPPTAAWGEPQFNGAAEAGPRTLVDDRPTEILQMDEHTRALTDLAHRRAAHRQDPV